MSESRIHLSTLAVRELTGHVTTIDSCCFAIGGFSDLWKGRLVDPDTGEVMEV
jgi:hypothetical protein